jgi:hypothetical protein
MFPAHRPYHQQPLGDASQFKALRSANSCGARRMNFLGIEIPLYCLGAFLAELGDNFCQTDLSSQWTSIESPTRNCGAWFDQNSGLSTLANGVSLAPRRSDWRCRTRSCKSA